MGIVAGKTIVFDGFFWRNSIMAAHLINKAIL